MMPQDHGAANQAMSDLVVKAHASKPATPDGFHTPYMV
jgi:hypothetical protein